MKKSLTLFLILCLSILLLPDSIYASNNTYQILNIDKKGNEKIIHTAPDYEEALSLFQNEKDQYDNLGIKYNDTYYQIEYGIVAFNYNDACSVNVEYTTIDQQNGYTNGCYGGDGAFLGYDADTNRVKFELSGVQGWALFDDVKIIPFESVPNVSSFKISDNILQHYIKSDVYSSAYSNILQLDQAPAYLKEDVVYYSYDTHYFYDSFYKMIDDYQKNQYDQALNHDNVYYNYYQFMNHRSTSNIDYDDFLIYLKKEKQFQDTIYDFQPNANLIHDTLSESLIMQGKEGFYHYQNQFQVNAMMLLSLALNESGNGRSALSFSRNNLFGHAAFDEAVDANASRYATVNDSIYSHAKHYICDSYLDPASFTYHGGQFGNKLGGLNVSYASDPYWGEKGAQYYYMIDQALGLKDKDHTSYVVTNTNGISIKKDANSSSDTIYSIDAGTQASFIVLDTIQKQNETWYKIASDISLNKDQEIIQDATSYNPTQSFGYINAKEIVYHNKSNQKQSNKKYNITFDAKQGHFYPNDQKVTLHVEEDKLPVCIEPTLKNHVFMGWDKEIKPATQKIVYNAIYAKIKDISLESKPKTTYIQNSYLNLSKGNLKVVLDNKQTKEIPLTTDMVSNFTSKNIGKYEMTITYAQQTISLPYEIIDAKDSEAYKLQVQASSFIKNLSEKTLTNEDIKSLNAYRKSIIQQKDNPLDIGTIRALDRIIEPALNPRLSVILEDDDCDLQVSGLSFAIQNSESFINEYLPKTIKISLKKIKDNDFDQKAQKVVNQNYMNYAYSFHIGGSDDFNDYNPLTDVVYSIKKPHKDNNKLYRILEVKDGKIQEVPSEQSDTRIVFQGSKGDYILAYTNVTNIKPTLDFTEVFHQQRNAKNYIFFLQLGIYGGIALIILIMIVITLLIIRHRNKVRARRRRAQRRKQMMNQTNHK